MDGERDETSLPPFSLEEALRALVERVMPPEPRRLVEGRKSRILPREIPPDLPLAVPLPPGSRLVGSVERYTGMEQAVIYLDAPGTPQQVLAFYRDRLSTGGWIERLSESGSGGFSAEADAFEGHTLFCQHPAGPALTVHVLKDEGEPADVRLRVYTDERASPCSAERRGSPPNPIPTLPPPSDARFVIGAGPRGNIGPGSAHSGLEIETHIGLTALADHYAHHLTAGGWRLLDSGHSGLLAWSTWIFTGELGERWRGLLLAVRRADLTDRYIIQVQAERIRGIRDKP